MFKLNLRANVIFEGLVMSNNQTQHFLGFFLQTKRLKNNKMLYPLKLSFQERNQVETKLLSGLLVKFAQNTAE